MWLPASPSTRLVLGGGLGKESPQLALCLPYKGVKCGGGEGTPHFPVFSSRTTHRHLDTVDSPIGVSSQPTALSVFLFSSRHTWHWCLWPSTCLKGTDDCTRGLWPRNQKRVSCSLGWPRTPLLPPFSAGITSVLHQCVGYWGRKFELTTFSVSG